MNAVMSGVILRLCQPLLDRWNPGTELILRLYRFRVCYIAIESFLAVHVQTYIYIHIIIYIYIFIYIDLSIVKKIEHPEVQRCSKLPYNLLELFNSTQGHSATIQSMGAHLHACGCPSDRFHTTSGWVSGWERLICTEKIRDGLGLWEVPSGSVHAARISTSSISKPWVKCWTELLQP